MVFSKIVYQLDAGDVVIASVGGRPVHREVASQTFNGRGMYVVAYADGEREVLNSSAVRTVVVAT